MERGIKMFKHMYINGKYKQFYFCDICGKLIKFDIEQLNKHKYMSIPFISKAIIGEDDEEIHQDNWVGDIHFHPSCYEEKIKPILIKRKVNKRGYDSFTKKRGITKTEQNNIRKLEKHIHDKLEKSWVLDKKEPNI